MWSATCKETYHYHNTTFTAAAATPTANNNANQTAADLIFTLPRPFSNPDFVA
jgi:hypothetical protein